MYKNIFIITFFIYSIIGSVHSQVSEEWVARYNGPSNGADNGNSVAVDAAGNVYVTGDSYAGSGPQADIVTIKYNSAGLEQWVARYNGTGDDPDVAVAIEADGAGNVYVSGYSYGTGTGSDYITIKYNSAGVQQWTAVYGESSTDQVRAMTIDASGNIYVTGNSSLSGSNYDYTTIKYNSAGIQQWVSRYNGTGNSYDYVYALKTDASGNVYVTGYSYGANADIVTIKYNSSGDSLWVQRYNGTGNGSDYGYDISIDAAGNVYITGSCTVSGYSDMITIKYNSAGVQQWINIYGTATNYDYGNSIAADASGNVYVTGYSGTAGVYDCLTIKYNSSGVQQWVSVYNEDYSNYAKFLRLDASNNVYVTGYSRLTSSSGYDYTTIKYNSSGVQQWLVKYNGPNNSTDEPNDIEIDNSGNIYVTGESSGIGTSYDYATVKYNSSGVQQWVSRFNPPGSNSDEANALVLDNAGNVYVTGLSYASGNDFMTVKYNSAGILQWTSRFTGPSTNTDEALAIAVDNNSNVYVTGRSYLNSSYDIVTIKYNSSGDSLWVKRYGPSSFSNDYPTSLAIDTIGNVYVAGYSYNSSSGNDYVTIKYNPSGDTLWVQKYNGTGNQSDVANSINVDPQGNVYVTGSSYGNGTVNDYATIKYNSSGVQQWVAIYNGPSGYESDVANSLAVDNSGNVYVTGSSNGIGSQSDIVTIKYNSSGMQQWVSRYNGTGNSNDNGRMLVLDASGNVYVTGSCSNTGSSYDYATIKYNSSGVQQWAASYSGTTGNYSDDAYSIALDASGNVYVTGASYISSSYCDFATLKYNSSGAQQWVIRYNGPVGNGYDYGRSVAVDAAGNVFVTGESYGINTSNDFATIKYSQVTGIHEMTNELPKEFKLHQNYPNPFNPATTIRFEIPIELNIKLSLYDILGSEVMTLLNEQLKAGKYELQFNAKNLSSGTYFYKLHSEQFSGTKKLVIIK